MPFDSFYVITVASQFFEILRGELTHSRPKLIFLRMADFQRFEFCPLFYFTAHMLTADR